MRDNKYYCYILMICEFYDAYESVGKTKISKFIEKRQSYIRSSSPTPSPSQTVRI